MKATKIFEGVYEFPSWKPEPVAEIKYSGVAGWDIKRERAHSRLPAEFPEFPDRKIADRLRMVVPNSRVHHDFHYYFAAGEHNSGARHWHTDGTKGIDTWTHTFLMIACDDPTHGTEFMDLGGQIFKGKVWTPYLMRLDVVHRSHQQLPEKGRAMYRFFLTLDESTLDISTLNE